MNYPASPEVLLQVNYVLMRDPRNLNHMDSETKLVHFRLEQWGEAKLDKTGTEFPEVTLLGKVIKFGLQGAAALHARGPDALSLDIAMTDAAVARLGAIDQGVIRAYYLRWEPPEVLWKRCTGIRSYSNFKAVLKRARWRVAGFLDGAAHVRQS